MRILFFARNTVWHPSSGGMERVLDLLAAELRGTGAETALVTSAGVTWPADIHDRFDATWEVRTRRPGRYSANWWRATGRAGSWDEWKPDVAIGIGDAGGAYGLRRDRTTPLVVQAHGTPKMESLSALATRSLRGTAQAALNIMRLPSRHRFFQAADEIWAIGQSVVDDLSSSRGLESKVVYMPNAVDSETFAFELRVRQQERHRLNLRPQDRVGVYAGRLHAQKGIDLAIDLLSLPNRELDHLIVVGDGPDEARLRRLVHSRGLTDHVTFAGRLPSSAVARLLSAADAFLLPTARREGLPMTILEAAANGIPLITSANAGVPADLASSTRVVISPLSMIDWNEKLSNLDLDMNLRKTSYLPGMYRRSDYANRHVERLNRILSTNRSDNSQTM